jgi:transposase-like protein
MKQRRHTAEKMKALYADWQQSGLSKKAFCQQMGIPHSSFFYWIKKFNSSGDSLSADFMELDFPASFHSEPVFLEIEYPSGARLKLYRQAEASWIKSLV